MVAINSGPFLHTTDLPSALQNALEARELARLSAAPTAGQSSARNPPLPLDRGPFCSTPEFSLTRMEKGTIIRALEYTRGDRVMAADLLGIGRTTLYRKLKKYSISQ
jgi:two-component system response regulator HydG